MLPVNCPRAIGPRGSPSLPSCRGITTNVTGASSWRRFKTTRRRWQVGSEGQGRQVLGSPFRPDYATSCRMVRMHFESWLVLPVFEFWANTRSSHAEGERELEPRVSYPALASGSFP